MRIINVIKTGDGGVIDSIDSFAVWEEQLSDEVVKKAEERFVQIAKLHMLHKRGKSPEEQRSQKTIHISSSAKKEPRSYRPEVDKIAETQHCEPCAHTQCRLTPTPQSKRG